MDERTEYWKIATDRLLDDKEGEKEGKDKAPNKQAKWLSLYAEERYAEPSFRLDLQRRKVVQWRLRERVRPIAGHEAMEMKTVSVALVMCLNIGVDPPDVIKTTPCARQECWIDPMSLPPQKAVDTIGKTLQLQYERWQPRAKYKMCLDPTVEAVKKLCVSLRRNAKEERILFHYNGHGVPKPTANGELWVFNKNYTQYIPLSLYELQHWVGSPSIYVFDCNAAGLIVKMFLQFAEQRKQELERNLKANVQTQERPGQEDHILLGACSANEVLPTNPNLPADVFTACLTTPIKIALKWFVSQTIISGVNFDIIDKIPGKLNDRRTPLGELNWIFTAVTDTIAWNVLPRPLFQKLFRQDLLVASLFRNFLLAERIMRSSRCTTVSYPKLPPTYNHPMWQAWDLACDYCIAQLPRLLANPSLEFKNCTFFAEQLTAFEVWLEFGTEDKKPPEQLPIVLQVLLSQQHRLRALILLARFLDLGSWAVNQALSVGIFPYVLKLLQSPAQELREVLVFIWAKILALDKSCQLDLVKDNGQFYFITVLSNTKVPPVQRTQAAFVLSVICNNCRPGQSACLNARLLQICLSQLNEPDSMLRRWIVFTLAKLWENYEDAKWAAIRESAHEKLCVLLTDPVPEVRAAAVYALGTFIGVGGAPPSPGATTTTGGPDTQRTEVRTNIELQLGLTLAIVTADASPMVRKELIVNFSNLVHTYHNNFVEVVKKIMRAEHKVAASLARKKAQATPTKGGRPAPGSNAPSPAEDDVEAPAETKTNEQESIYEFLWKLVVSLTTDPYPDIARLSSTIYNQIRTVVLSQDADLRKVAEQQATVPGSQRSRSPVRAQPAKKAMKSEKKYQSFSNLLSVKKQEPVEDEEDNDDSLDLPNEEIRSNLYDWSCTFFSAPLNRPTDEDETAPEYSQRKWRQQRNEYMIKEAKILNEKGCKKLENEIAILENDTAQMVSLVVFHPFENVIVVSDEKDGIAVWNWEEGVAINRFSNCNALGTRITSLNLINEFDIAMIAVGSDDGVVRIWNGIYSSDTCRLVSSWKALSTEQPGVPGTTITGAGLIVDWQQHSELLFASGNVDVIRIWDANKELSVQEVQTNAESAVTCLATDKTEGQKLIIAGCTDGSVRLYDIRQPNTRYSAVATFSDQRGCVINVFKPTFAPNTIISGATSGVVKFWDPRGTSNQAVKSFVSHNTAVMTAFAVHDQAPLIATGSQDQRIKVHNLSGDELSLIRYHDGFLGQRIGSVSALNFHPYHTLLGAGTTDSLVSIYAGDNFKNNLSLA